MRRVLLAGTGGAFLSPWLSFAAPGVLAGETAPSRPTVIQVDQTTPWLSEVTRPQDLRNVRLNLAAPGPFPVTPAASPAAGTFAAISTVETSLSPAADTAAALVDPPGGDLRWQVAGSASELPSDAPAASAEGPGEPGDGGGTGEVAEPPQPAPDPGKAIGGLILGGLAVWALMNWLPGLLKQQILKGPIEAIRDGALRTLPVPK